MGVFPGLSVYGCGLIQPTGGTRKANTIDPATYWQYLIPFSRSKYARNGSTNRKNVARLIISDLGSKPEFGLGGIKGRRDKSGKIRLADIDASKSFADEMSSDKNFNRCRCTC